MVEIQDRVQAPEDEEWSLSTGARLRAYLGEHLNVIVGTLSVLTFLALWEGSVALGLMDPIFVSSPTRVAGAAVEYAGAELWNDLAVSGLELAVGFGLAMAIGIPFGFLLGWYRPVYAVFGPFVSFFYATPRIALLPLIIIWVGIGIWSKVAIVFLGAVFPIIITVDAGVRAVDKVLLDASRSFGANDWQIMRTIALPASVPFILAGLRLGIGRALVGVVVGELFAARAGVGYRIVRAGSLFQTDKVIVGVLIIACAGVLFMESFKVLEKRFARWRV